MPIGGRDPGDGEYEGYEALLGLVDKERAGGLALGWDHRRMRRLLGRLGDPHLGLRCTLVTGSKGKGSTAAFLASILEAAGRPTGLYAQPHLHRYAERIQVGGRPLPPERARAFLEQVLAAAPGPVTAFEAATATALLAFRTLGVREAVVEAGFGGRLDAAAECEPELVLLTPLEAEHADLLGPTLADVADHELGLLAYGRTCLYAPQAAEVEVRLVARAHEAGARAVAVPVPPLAPPGAPVALASLEGDVFRATLGLPGSYQRGNAALAAAAAELLGVGREAVVEGLARARWPGRFEAVARDPDVVVDGAHTPGSARALAEALAHAYPDRPLALVVGLLGDKDALGFARALPPAEAVWAVAPPHPRAVPAADLVRALAAAGRPARTARALEDALGAARAAVGSGGVVVVTGSLTLVAAARAALGAAGWGPGAAHPADRGA
jgi:dihydrofolate synthase/folylpolyglutamate synthase